MKKTYKIIAILLLTIMLTGCTRYVKVDKKTITIKKTGQNLTDNILCKPEDKETLELYDKYAKKLSFKMNKLPDCNKFKANSKGYTGIWESVFIKPLAFLILKLGYLMNFKGSFGVSIMILGLAIRLLLFPFSISTAKQQKNMKLAQPKLKKIEAKYANKNDQESMMMKSQETMAVYKELKINPMASCLVAFIQLPIFLAFLEAIYRIPVVFEDSILGLNLGMTPLKGVTTAHNYFYIVVFVLVLVSTFFSFRNAMKETSNGMPAQEGMPNPQQQTKMMTYMMIIMIGVASINLSTAILLYWIVTNTFAIFQNLILKKIVK